MALTIDHRPVMHAANLYRAADRDLRKQMRQTVTREINPWLRSAIRRTATGRVETAIASTARVRTGQRPAVLVGSAKRVGRGGATTAELAPVYEFGGYRQYVGRHNRRNAPRPYKRHTQRQIPRTAKSGRFIYPAVADAAPMLVRAWVEVIADAYREASDG